MPMTRFTKFINKVLTQRKTRTIRKPRKCNCGFSVLDKNKTPSSQAGGPIQPAIYMRDECICKMEEGKNLHIYVMFKVGEATVTRVQEIDRAWQLTEEDAILDGFKNSEEAEKLLVKMHSTKKDRYDGPFDVIDFAPHWEPLIVVKLSDLEEVKARVGWHTVLTDRPEILKKLEEMINGTIPNT